MITRGAQLSTRGPHALTGGPSVQVQFPHLKISTLTTDDRIWLAKEALQQTTLDVDPSSHFCRL